MKEQIQNSICCANHEDLSILQQHRVAKIAATYFEYKYIIFAKQSTT